MTKSFQNLQFSPKISEIVQGSPSKAGSVNIFTGANNSGKSAYLKQTVDQSKQLYIGVNRFNSFHHLAFYTENDQELPSFFQQLQSAKVHPYQNFEGAFFNTATALTRLSNERRAALFDVFKQLFGTTIEVLSENPSNDFSNRYVSVGGDSLSVTSSGTRLFLGLLAAVMDERFELIAIDEPELGLSPVLQRRLADILIKGEHADRLFPHSPNIVLSTHSHIFLDKSNPPRNWIVTKDGDTISARPCSGIGELHDLQLRLLGNDLGELFLPHAVLFVEGKTDKSFLQTVLRFKLPKMKIVIQECGGDIAQRLTYWSQTIGDIQVSPYRDRTFAIYDKVEQSGLDKVCARIGLPDQNKIKWSGNGIEYVYPTTLLAQIYKNASITASDLTFEGDAVACNGISYKKVELCTKVCDLLTPSTELPAELVLKLMKPLEALGQ